MKHQVLLAAELDIQRAYLQYENQEEGLGDLLAAQMELAFTRLEQFPFVAPLFFESYRRLVLKRFPYGIFYVVESDRVMVHAVMDLRQDPDTIRKRLLGEL